MLPTPRGRSYLMPAGSIAALFKKNQGTHGVVVKSAPPGLDIAASRAGNTLYLHVVNVEYSRAVEATFPGMLGGRVHEIAPEDPRAYVNQDQPDTFRPRVVDMTGGRWKFPARSVSVVEMKIQI
jgi:alpha-L-arabinofuranosidase